MDFDLFGLSAGDKVIWTWIWKEWFQRKRGIS